MSPLVVLVLALVLCSPAYAQTYSVPMQAQNQQRYVIVACKIEGIERELRCMIDSGAAQSMVSNRILKAAGSGGSSNMVTPNGETLVFTRKVYFTIGTLKFSGVCILPPLDPRMQFDAVIGEDVLQLFAKVTLDFSRRMVIFERK